MNSRLNLSLCVGPSCALQKEKTIAKAIMASVFDEGVHVQCTAEHCQMLENCCANLYFPGSWISCWNMKYASGIDLKELMNGIGKNVCM